MLDTLVRETLLSAEIHFLVSDDDKMFVSQQAMTALLIASKWNYLCLNVPAMGGHYLTEVVFAGRRFITATESPIDATCLIAGSLLA